MTVDSIFGITRSIVFILIDIENGLNLGIAPRTAVRSTTLLQPALQA